MGWVVKSLRGDALAALAAASAAGAVRDAERDARRIRRSAARETDAALSALSAVEFLAVDSRERVRIERLRLRSRGGAPSGARETDPAPVTPARRSAGPARRRGRASLRESPVVELFRRT